MLISNIRMGKIDIEKEKEFCELMEFKKNEHGQFIYQSSCGTSIINLPYILQEYKEFLIEEGIVKEVEKGKE